MQKQVGFSLSNLTISNLRWTIPLSYSFHFKQTYFEILRNDQESITIRLMGDKDQPVYFNVLSAGNISLNKSIQWDAITFL